MKKKLLYFYTDDATFVEKDIRILEEEYVVIKKRFNVSKKWLLPFSFLIQVYHILLNAPGSAWIVVQFGGYHSFLPTLLSRVFSCKTAIVLGGYDCVSFPEIGYGAFNNRLMKPFVKASYKRAHLLLPVHEALIYKSYEYFNATNKAQGFEVFTGRLKTPHRTIYNGYDIEKWSMGKENLTPSFITVAGGCEEKRRRVLKGVDLFIDLARFLPEYSFIVVGANHWGEELPKNLKLIPRTKNTDLLELYQNNMFYLQLSLSEGFPNALSESMLCGCIPIVSDVSSMPDLVEGAGYVLHNKEVNELLHLVKIAVSEYSRERKLNARNNIAKRYTEERRSRELLQVLRNH